MRTKIISAFPGCGKTSYYNENKETTLDSDSSEFSWSVDENGKKTRNSEFPKNYIDHIKANIGKYKIIFVSSHKEVRDALLDECIFFYLVYPEITRKNEFLDRYKERGSDENFIRMLDGKWFEWIEAIEKEEAIGFSKIRMVLPFLKDEIRHMGTHDAI